MEDYLTYKLVRYGDWIAAGLGFAWLLFFFKLYPPKSVYETFVGILMSAVCAFVTLILGWG